MVWVCSTLDSTDRTALRRELGSTRELDRRPDTVPCIVSCTVLNCTRLKGGSASGGSCALGTSVGGCRSCDASCTCIAPESLLVHKPSSNLLYACKSCMCAQLRNTMNVSGRTVAFEGFAAQIVQAANTHLTYGDRCEKSGKGLKPCRCKTGGQDKLT